MEVAYETTNNSHLPNRKPGVGNTPSLRHWLQSMVLWCSTITNWSIILFLSLWQYDGYAKIPDFAWEAIGNIRRCVLTFLAKEQYNSYILTNSLYEDAGDQVCYAEVVYMAEGRGSLFVPIRLLIDQDEHLKRITSPSRRDRWKSIDPQDVYDETPLLYISHPNLLELNVSNLSAEDAAEAIMNHIKILSQR